MLEPTTAVHAAEVRQSTAARVPDPSGAPWSFQVVPLSDVVTTWEPTAIQLVGLAQETPLSDTTAGAV